MRKGFGLALGWLAALGFFVSALAAPSVFVEQAVYDFGVVTEGDEVAHDFVIWNRGDQVLQILDVRAGCGCTTTSLSGETVPPGRAVRLGVRLDTSGYAGSRVTKAVTVKTNDPTQPEIRLEIAGQVVSKEPYLLDAAELVGSLALLIDLRAPAAYAAGHLLGAVSVTRDELMALMDELPRDLRIVLYDQDGSMSSQVAADLIRAGYSNVQVLMGGFDEWTREYGERLVTTIPFYLGLPPG